MSAETTYFSNLSPEEFELLSLLSEECAEVVQAVSKIFRHGKFSSNPDHTAPDSNIGDLQREIGHVIAAVKMLSSLGVTNRATIVSSELQKLNNVDKYLHHGSSLPIKKVSLMSVDRYYDEFVELMWRYEPAQHGGMPELGYLGLAVVGEAGEVAEKIKKAYRESDGVPSREALLKELGDLLFYLVKTAHFFNYTLHDVVHGNILKLQDREVRGKMHGEGDDR